MTQPRPTTNTDQNLKDLFSAVVEATNKFDIKELDDLHERVFNLIRNVNISGSPDAWFNRDPDLLKREARILSRHLTSEADRVSLGINEHGQLTAVGRFKVSAKKQVSVAVVFPDDYPATGPTVFLRKSGHLEPVTTEPNMWSKHDDSGVALEQARVELAKGGP